MERHHRQRSKRDTRVPIQPCFSGVSVTLFTIVIVCIMVAMKHMEGPFLYLNIIYALYVLIVAAFVFQILLDLFIWVVTKTGSPGTRNFLSRLCPILCIGMSIPPVALLWHTKNRGGFLSVNADLSLVFSLIVGVIELFHLLATIYVFRNHDKNTDEAAVQFSYRDTPSLGPSPASSIRSGRIDFIMNRSRNSLASIDSSFAYGYDNTRDQRATALEVNRRFWEEQLAQQQAHRYPDEGPPRRRHERRPSDASVASFASVSSKKSVASNKSSRSTSSKSSKRSQRRGDLRMEEEMEYNPGFLARARMW